MKITQHGSKDLTALLAAVVDNYHITRVKVVSRNVTCLDVPCDGVVSLSVDGKEQRGGKLEKLSYYIDYIPPSH